MEKRRYADRRDELLAATRLKRRRVKRWAVDYKGGQCVVCGYSRYIGALELHHIVGHKKFGIGDTGYTKSWVAIREEVDKCVLLCANCHREVEAKVTRLPDKLRKEKVEIIG